VSDPSSRVRCRRGSGQRAAPSFVGALLLGAALLAVGCAPNPSTVPLGLGPLAVAEQARDAEATATRRQKSAAGAAASRTPSASSSAPKAPLPAAESEEDAGGDDQTAGTEPSDPSEPAFEGTYAGEDVAIYRLTGFPEREERDDKAKIRIEKASGGNLGITLINSADGSDLCELIARVEGKTALLESTQPCFSDGSEGSLEAELTSGRVVLDGDRLKMNAEGTLSVSLPDQDLDGQLTYSFEGKRE
jgi:hypothetical protein